MLTKLSPHLHFSFMKKNEAHLAFRKLSTEYRDLQKDLKNVKEFALELQKKNRGLMIENERLRNS